MPRFLASEKKFTTVVDGTVVGIESNFSERFRRFPRGAHAARYLTRSNDKPVVVKALQGNRRRGTLSLQMRAAPI